MNSDGNFHFLSEAEAINRDLAISLNRDVEIEQQVVAARTAGSSSRSAIAGSSASEESWEFGALGLVSYDNTWRNRERIERDVADPINLVENRFRTINQVSATGVLNLGLNFTSDHQLTTSSFYSAQHRGRELDFDAHEQQLSASATASSSATTTFASRSASS